MLSMLFAVRKKNENRFISEKLKECSSLDLMTIVAMSTTVLTQPQAHISTSMATADMSITILEQVRQNNDSYRKERGGYFIRK